MSLTLTSHLLHFTLTNTLEIKNQIKFKPLEVSTASSETQMRAHLADKYSSQWIWATNRSIRRAQTNHGRWSEGESWAQSLQWSKLHPFSKTCWEIRCDLNSYNPPNATFLRHSWQFPTNAWPLSGPSICYTREININTFYLPTILDPGRRAEVLESVFLANWWRSRFQIRCCEQAPLMSGLLHLTGLCVTFGM